MLQPEPITFEMPSINTTGIVIEEMRGWTTQTPGVVVHETKWVDDEPLTEADLAKAWTVTHLRSGCAICGAPGPEQAMAIAKKLATLPVDFLATGVEVEAAINQWQRDTGLDFFATITASNIDGPSASKFDLFYRR